MTTIFVFGSNLAGRHGKGAALHARRYCGAIYGQGEGLQRSSYAIPTKDGKLNRLSIDEIRVGIEKFITFVRLRPDLHFLITPIGCGLAGYAKETIKPLFGELPENCTFSREWYNEHS